MGVKLKTSKLPNLVKKPSKFVASKITNLSEPQRLTLFILVFAAIGSIILIATHAASPSASIEPENGSIAGKASICSDSGSSGGSCVKFGSFSGLPAVPASEQMCTNGKLAQSPWPATNVPTNLLSSANLTSFTSGQYGLPTFGAAGTNFPNATAGMIVPTGGNFYSSMRTANTVYWLAPGNHPIGQVNPGNNSAFVGATSTNGALSGMSTWNGAGNEYGIYNFNASNVTIEYVNMTGWNTNSMIAIFNDISRDNQTWHIAYNYIHDFGGSNNGNPQGKGIHGEGHIDHNCFKHIGQTGINFFGDGTHIEFNDFDDNGWASDTQCGCNGGMKGWETANAEINNNYVHNTGPNGYGIWLDTSNIGYNIHDNYLSWNVRRAIEIEISQHGTVTNNVLAYNGFINSAGIQNGGQAALNFNATGAVNLAGTYSNNQILVSGNILWNNWEGLSIYAQDDRNCVTPQPFNNYCTLTDKFSFSHASAGDNSLGGEGGGKLQQTCTNCSQILVNYQYALGDKIGFSSGNYPYMVTAITPAGGQPAHVSMAPPNHTGNWTVTVSPAISGSFASGTNVFGAGTCELYFTGSANPSSPTPASLNHGTQTISYFDGCQWLPRNYLIQNNTFHFNPTEIVNSTPTWPITFTSWPAVFEGVTFDARKCTSNNYLNLTQANPTGNNNYCGMNAMFGRPASYSNNAIMSNSSFTAPLNNLDANAAHPEGPYNNRWIGNTYDGPIGFRAYQETNSAAPPNYNCAGVSGLPNGFTAVCVVNAAGWASVWQQH